MQNNRENDLIFKEEYGFDQSSYGSGKNYFKLRVEGNATLGNIQNIEEKYNKISKKHNYELFELDLEKLCCTSNSLTALVAIVLKISGDCESKGKTFYRRITENQKRVFNIRGIPQVD